MPPTSLILVRVGAIVVALALWFLTQWLLARRAKIVMPEGVTIDDGIHTLTARWNRRLNDNPKLADRLLIVSSAVIDAMSLFVFALSVFGPTLRPFVALLMLFILRQLCQFASPLPAPRGMVWRYPGFPSALVTYGTSSDFFFSGHTSLAVLGACCLATTLGPVGIALGVIVALFEMGTVLVLRAHYTMDVFTGLITALYAYHLAGQVVPSIDGWLRGFVG
ncbi:MAG: phosphatase PAP2-related protein [Tepidisphaeraceae bacterium]